MIEYRTVVPPFEPDFIERLQALAADVFGDIDRDEIGWRLTHMPDPSAHVANMGQLIGFKLGYATSRTRYESWLGGVRGEQRREGIALRLMEAQHDWLRARGYVSVETATTSNNLAMLALNLRVGFTIVGSYDQGNGLRVAMLHRFGARPGAPPAPAE